jgi:hypothetical protein
MWKYYDNEEYINKQISMYQDFARWGTEWTLQRLPN